MKTKELVERARTIAQPFRIANGNKFRLRDVDPTDTLKFTSEDKERAKEALQIGTTGIAEIAGHALRTRQMGSASDFSSDGRCW
jgi:hypothetical protein